MDQNEFRVKGKELVDFIIDYHENIEKYQVTPQVEPGYLKEAIPPEAPEEPEKWDDILKDIKGLIMKGVTHWLHPNFCAFFPVGFCYPSLMADMLSDALACLGLTWAASPACTELETIVLDWLAKMTGLPSHFLASPEDSEGGGVLQGSASECILVCLLAARYRALKKLSEKDPEGSVYVHFSKLVAYCSKEAHSCVEKATLIGLVRLRILDTDDRFRMRSCTSCDRLDEIGPVCKKYGLWMHVDAAYAGSALICPEFRHFLEGVEQVDSMNMNPTKWMLVNPDCSAMWVRDRKSLTDTLTIEPVYLQHMFSKSAIDYRHWGIPLSRRFRSLKLWFTIRNHGVVKLREYIRNHVALAKVLAKLITDDGRFQVINDVNFGLVCFRLKQGNDETKRLLESVQSTRNLYMVAASLGGLYVIRYSVNYRHATEDLIRGHWKTICEHAKALENAR